jgi:oligopeptide/dipeptide ABC transporter ATP-binding protein
MSEDDRDLLRVEDLAVEFVTDAGVVRAVDGVSFHIRPGETLAVVGESGCGKSVTAMSILGLLPMPPARIASGSIRLGNEELLTASDERLRAIRGNDIAMIFQEPMTSLNPVYTVGEQIIEAIALHRGVSQEEARTQTIALLELVGIPAPGQRVDEYPHQLSGGMCQRVMIAMALACDPLLLIADEPTTALDVTIQAQILDLLRELQRDLGMSVLLITHDLGVVAEMAHRVVVMYAGQVVERADVVTLFARPRHPYTAGLFRSIPKASAASEQRQLEPIEGSVPDALDFPAGCRFHPRCPQVLDACRSDAPLPAPRGEAEHESACWYVDRHPDEDLLA